MKIPSVGPHLRGKGYKIRLKNCFHQICFQFFYAVERIGGAAMVPWLMAPINGMDWFNRRRDYRQFVRLRNAMPAGFWKGTDPRRHYFKMLRDWQEMIGTILSYHRLGSPYWQKRFQVSGKPPHALPEWGKRPMILAYLHTGPFGLNTYWLRSQGIPVVSLVTGLPPVLETEYFQKMMAIGNLRYGIEGIPQRFERSRSLREGIRFLTPGHALTVAIDGGKLVLEDDRHDAGGFPILVQNGACRLAAQTNAVVIPVAVRRTAPCCFEIRFGKPVPDELIQKGDFAAGTQHLISELWPDLKENPMDLNWTTLEALAPTLKGSRQAWP